MNHVFEKFGLSDAYYSITNSNLEFIRKSNIFSFNRIHSKSPNRIIVSFRVSLEKLEVDSNSSLTPVPVFREGLILTRSHFSIGLLNGTLGLEKSSYIEREIGASRKKWSMRNRSTNPVNSFNEQRVKCERLRIDPLSMYF